MEIGAKTPLGRSLWEANQAVTREFDRRLSLFDGNRAVWFIYVALDQGTYQTQRQLASLIGITEATLTHHLNNLVERGLISRDRDTVDRRVQRIEFTDAGRAAFIEMRTAAVAFDLELRTLLGADAVSALQSGLGVLAAEYGDPQTDAAAAALGRHPASP